MELVFLGTAAMVPTKERNHSAVFLSYKNEGLLFDCGEGTQRQLKIAGITVTKLTRIFITHWHGDHVLGLLGVLQTLGSSEYQGTLEIYAPKGCKKFFEAMCQGLVFDFRINMDFFEVESGQICETKEFYVECAAMQHGIPCLGFSFVEKDRRKINMSSAKKFGLSEGPLIGDLQEGKTVDFKGKKIKPDDVSSIVKGRKVAYITDTRPNANCNKLAKDADILVCESSYASDLAEKAEEYHHMTASEAAQIANKNQVKKLILTHFSARYKNTLEVEEDARTYFNNVLCAKDFMRVNV